MQCDMLGLIHGRGNKSQVRRWVAQIVSKFLFLNFIVVLIQEL